MEAERSQDAHLFNCQVVKWRTKSAFEAALQAWQFGIDHDHESRCFLFGIQRRRVQFLHERQSDQRLLRPESCQLWGLQLPLPVHRRSHRHRRQRNCCSPYLDRQPERLRQHRPNLRLRRSGHIHSNYRTLRNVKDGQPSQQLPLSQC